MGAARSGNTAGAQADIEKLKEQRTALEKGGQGYWAGQVEIQILAAQAWMAQGQDNKSDALKFMRAAADLEDASEKHVAMENRLYPMRELLADMLMTQGEAVAALKEYEASLKNAPMRLRGFYGAAQAAEASGDAKKAREYFEKLARLTKNADGGRPAPGDVIGARVVIGLLGLGLVLLPGRILADPTDEASKEQVDPEYAAGKAAIATKDWTLRFG